jgi:formiminotetrahydrofolate cyclodeaminase
MTGPAPAEGLGELRLQELLDRLAARTPAPGGGAASALGCAVAAALIQMAAGFSREDDAAELAGRAAALRARALELADLELVSYLPVLEALRLPADEPERAAQIAAASSDAAESPLQIAALAAELAELAVAAAQSGSPHLLGDATAAASLADGACGAAARLVEINLAEVPGDPRRIRAQELADEASAARDAILALGPGARSR